MVFVNKKLIKNHCFIIIFILVLFINTRVFSTEKYFNEIINIVNNKNLYDSYKWKALLHYNNKTNIKDDKFWLSKERTLKSELITIIDKIYNSNFEEKKNIVCRFPARIKFLINEVNIEKKLIENIKCEEFEEYLNALSAEKIYLSYASENIISPASMMGHLFLKISGFNKKQNRIVDNSLNYFATLNLKKESAIMFYIKSLFSGSNGFYDISPYKQKLMEYNDEGSRNIYNYELNFNKDQIDYFIYHIWELKDIIVPYNFIKHNCGTAALTVLNVVNEDFEDILNNFYITPIDILKKLNKKNLIKSIELYPTDSYKIQLFKDNFNKNEQKDIKNFVLKNDNKILYNKRKNDLLFMADMVSGAYVFDKKISVEQYNKVQKNIYNNFDGMNTVNLKQVEKNQLKSPFSSSIKALYNDYKNNSGVELSFYPVYREIIDNNSQYFNDFSLLMLNTNVFVGNKIILKNFDLLKLKSIIPSNSLLPTFSFNFKIGYQDSYEENNNNGNFVSEIGLGKSFDFNGIIPYFIVNGGYFIKPYFKLESGFILNFKKTKTVANYDYFLQHNRNLKSIFSINESIFLNDKFSFLFSFERKFFKNNKKSYNSISSGLKIYF